MFGQRAGRSVLNTPTRFTHFRLIFGLLFENRRRYADGPLLPCTPFFCGRASRSSRHARRSGCWCSWPATPCHPWRPDRLRSPWQGARYGEPLTNEQAPRAAPTALHGMPEFTPRTFPSLSCPYSATRCKIGSGKDRAIAARLDQVGQYLPHS